MPIRLARPLLLALVFLGVEILDLAELAGAGNAIALERYPPPLLFPCPL